MKKLLLMLLVGSALGFTACSDEPAQGDKETPEVSIDPVTVSSVTFTAGEARANEAVNGFALNFINTTTGLFDATFEDEATRQSKNFSVSPVSAALCLALTANSVDDASSDNIAKVLDFEDLNALNSTVGKLISFLPCEESGAIISLANSVWANQKYTLDHNYISHMNDLFQSEVKSIDMGAPDAASLINKWVELKTKNRISNLIQELDPGCAAVLVNALYFAGDWEVKFDKSQTTNENFNGTNGVHSVPMMHREELLEVAEGTNFDMVNLPFKGWTRIVLALPKEGADVSDASFRLTDADMAAVQKKSALSLKIIDLSLPSFTTESSSTLNSVFKTLGIKCDFTTLSKMGIAEEVFYYIVQKTSTTVNEDGAVAAAATANTTTSDPGEPVEYERVKMEFNRPFMFFIVNDKTGSILMAGRICNL